MKKRVKRTLWALGGVLVALVAILIGISFYFLDYALSPEENNPTCNPDSCR
ncbi:MAG: alpha/beta hydrolase, partial [Bacteroidaceae bacterium]|nr:alpha/beta hydrolase [Bacteroidaceae bacterium]